MDLITIEKMILNIDIRLKKINDQIIQSKYHYSEKGTEKVKRNNARRRLKNYYKKVLKELIKVTVNGSPISRK